MKNDKYINIDYPFNDSKEGFYLNLNKSDSKAIRADLMHLILTRKGERFYMPDFGTNLLKYIFNQNDSTTHFEIKTDIQEAVNKYIPNLNIDSVTVNESEVYEYRANVRIDYTITDDIFKESDFIIINV